MTENEKELIRIVRESSNPEKAVMIAIEIIARYIQGLS